MSIFRRLIACVCLCSLSALGGCAVTSSDFWQSPSILTTRPPPPPPEAKREIRGGFTVAVDVPGQPTSARVISDIGAFARQRGFVLQGANPAPPQRYVSGKIILEISYDAAHLRVSAYLHSSGNGSDRKLIGQFDADFQEKYAGVYGDQSAISESDYGDNVTGPSRGRSGSRGGPGGG